MASVLDVINPITIANYVQGAWDGISQNNPFFDKLKKSGNIKKNVTGDNVTWTIEGSRHTPQIVAPYQDINEFFVPKKRYVQATMGWAEVLNAVAIDKGQLRRNDGAQALVKLRDVEFPAMVRDLIVGTNGIAHQILNMNGSTYSGTGLPVYGLPSALLGPGATGLNGFDGVSTVTGLAPAATDIEVIPTAASQTYAGLSLARSGLTGLDGDAEPDAWTPLLVNSTSSGWGTGASAKNNVLEYLSHAISRASRFSASDPTKLPDLALGSFTYFQYLRNAVNDKQTIYLTDKVTKDRVFGVGSNPNMVYHDGLEFTWDENMPAGFYILNTKQIFLDCQPIIGPLSGDKNPLKGGAKGSDMFETEVAFNDGRRAVTISVTFPGMLRFNPRYQVRVAPYA